MGWPKWRANLVSSKSIQLNKLKLTKMTMTTAQNDSFTIEVRSTEGHDTKHSAESLESALKKAKTARTQANRMVKILEAGYTTHRWDRTNVIGENRWRKVNPGEMEILGNPAPITVTRVVRRTSV